MCQTLIKQDSGANIFTAEKRSQIHRCFLALAAVQAQQILHVQVFQPVSECTQDGGKACGTSGGLAAGKEEFGTRPSVPGCSILRCQCSVSRRKEPGRAANPRLPGYKSVSHLAFGVNHLGHSINQLEYSGSKITQLF